MRSRLALSPGVQVLDLGLQGLPAAGQGPQGGFGGGGISQGTGAQGGAGTDALAGSQPTQRAADLLRGGDDDGVDLRTGLDACFHRAPAGHPQHPDHLHLRVPRLGSPASTARLDGAGGGLGIKRVGLAVAAAIGAVGPVDLDHGQPVVGQEPQRPAPKLPVPSMPTLSTAPNDSAQIASSA